jgi:hypothetical protein
LLKPFEQALLMRTLVINRRSRSLLIRL